MSLGNIVDCPGVTAIKWDCCLQPWKWFVFSTWHGRICRQVNSSLAGPQGPHGGAGITCGVQLSGLGHPYVISLLNKKGPPLQWSDTLGQIFSFRGRS